MKRSGISLYVILVAGCSGFLHGAMQDNRPPEIFTAMKQDAKSGQARARDQMELQRQADSLRDVERIRNLPPHVVAAVAHEKISFKDLQFTDDGVWVDNGVIPLSAPDAHEADKTTSSFTLRAVGLVLSLVLVIVGLTMRRSQAKAAALPSQGNKKAVKVNDLEG